MCYSSTLEKCKQGFTLIAVKERPGPLADPRLSYTPRRGFMTFHCDHVDVQFRGSQTFLFPSNRHAIPPELQVALGQVAYPNTHIFSVLQIYIKYQ